MLVLGPGMYVEALLGKVGFSHLDSHGKYKMSIAVLKGDDFSVNLDHDFFGVTSHPCSGQVPTQSGRSSPAPQDSQSDATARPSSKEHASSWN